MHATFFVNTLNIGGPSYGMSWAQLQNLASDGNEIGGHTLHHVDLTTLTPAEVQTEVCDDRQALLDHGFSPVSFAYPFGAFNPAVEQIVRGCGYSSARGITGLWNSCTSCQYSETVPPADAFATRSAGSVNKDTPLSELQGFVTQAEQHGGGWVQIVFHQICTPPNLPDGCESLSTSLPTLTAFLDWLQPRSATGTVVKTVQEALASAPVGDGTPPVTSIACNGAACSTSVYGTAVAVSLSPTDAGGSGLAATRYTIDGSEPSSSSPLYTAPFTIPQPTTLDTAIVKYRSWDNNNNAEATHTQTILLGPAPPPPGTIEKASGKPTSASSSESSAVGPQFANDGTTNTRWSSLFQNNQWWQVDLGSNRAVTNATIGFYQYAWPTTYTISTSLDGINWTIVKNETLTTYGTKTSTFTQTTARYIRITGLTRGTSAGTSIEEALIYGPADPIDTTAPVTSIACNGTTCSSSAYAAAVTVSLSASDGGSGVAATRYTTNGSDPTSSSPVYTGPFTIPQSATLTTTTVKYRSWDNSNNAETTKTQTITITPPPSGGGGGGGGGGGSGAADLRLTGSAEPVSVPVGGTITWRLRVFDSNLRPATGVVVDVTLPAGVSLALAQTDRGSGCASTGTQTLRCNLDWLSSDVPYGNITLVSKVTAAGELALTATAASAQADPTPADNTLALKANTPAPVAPPPVPKPTAVELVFGKLTASPLAPAAGKRFVLTLPVTRSFKPLATARIVSTARLAGKKIKHSSRFANGKARLTLMLPKAAKNKSLKFTISIISNGTTARQTFTYTVR
jgi:hypothetical protein